MTIPKRSAGTLFRPREQLPWSADEPFRILSIDGGGIKGILPAALLARIEEEITGGLPAGRYFDMIAGTSTGGIIALALGIGLPASTVHKIYVDQGAEIFPRKTARSPILRRLQLAWRALNDLHRYRHDADALERALSGAFGAAMLGQCERRLVVPAFDWNTEVFLFKTPHHPDYKLDWPNPLVTVARATSAAPTYFRAFKGADRRFLDGGVWANNPIMCALVDALACYDVERRAIEILSIGCADDEYVMSSAHETGGLWAWRKIFSAAAQLQSQNAIGQARLLIGGDRVHRLDGRAPRPIEMDDYESAAELLPALAQTLFDDNRAMLQRFFGSERPAFQAWHGPRAPAPDVRA